jgi:hypothetical protein
MAKSIKLTELQWMSIHRRIQEEYPTKPSVVLIRTTMLRELGFTVRHHQEWIKKSKVPGDDLNFGYYEDSVYLDFYDDIKETFFRLKYL